MACPDCASTATTRRKRRTALGYGRFRCRACRRRFNDLQYPTDIVLLAVLWRLRYKLGFRDVAELLLQRGYAVTHETIHDRKFRFTPLLADRLRAKRRGRRAVSWYLDETYVKIAGRWCYLYRAIDRAGGAPRLHAQRPPRQARSPTLPPATRRGDRAQAAARDDRCPSCVPQGHPLDLGEESVAPMQPVLEQRHRAKPSGRQAAVLSYARRREVRVGGALLFRVR